MRPGALSVLAAVLEDQGSATVSLLRQTGTAGASVWSREPERNQRRRWRQQRGTDPRMSYSDPKETFVQGQNFGPSRRGWRRLTEAQPPLG